MPFSKCKDVIDRLDAIANDEAGLVEKMRFFGHLAMCADCKRYYDQFMLVKNTVGQVEPEALSTDFERVMGFVLEETGLEHATPSPEDPGESPA